MIYRFADCALYTQLYTLHQAGSVGRAGRPQAWAPAGAGWQGVSTSERVGRREKWLYFSYTRDTLQRFAEAGASRVIVRLSTTLSDAALTELERMAAQGLS